MKLILCKRKTYFIRITYSIYFTPKLGHIGHKYLNLCKHQLIAVMTARTRNATDKFFGKEWFAPIKKFSLGKLPILKEVIGRYLTFKDYKFLKIIKSVSEELHNLWITYNVYPISVNGIHKQLKTIIMEFNRLV